MPNAGPKGHASYDAAPMGDGDFDRIDRHILDVLQREGRISNQELAERVALSASPCLRRVKRLEAAGVIRRYAALLDPAKIGLGLLAYVNVKLEKRASHNAVLSPAEEFGEAIQQWPEVVSCYAMTGDLDYLIRVQVRDLDHFSSVMMDRLLKLPNVLDVRSSFALKTIKESDAFDVR